MVPRMSTLVRDGVRLYYERHGDAGEPLVCIMGLGATLELWQFQTPMLTRAHQVLIYDNRGVGRSDKPAGPYDVPTLADDAIALMDACGWARAHVLGVSMGGMIAQDVAIRYPDRVGALVLACTYARPNAEVRASAARSTWDPKSIDVKQLFKAMMGVTLSAEFIARERTWLRALRDQLLPLLNLDGFFAQYAAAIGHDTVAQLASITAPTLVMMPTADALIPPQSSLELAELIDGATLAKFEGASHGFNIEQPDKFNQTVIDFVARHPLAELPRF
jgi:3-oxoadipate enol-lactonase